MTITARFPGRCSRCGGAIQPGSQIDWDKSTRTTRHVTCPKANAAQTPAAKPVATTPAAPPPEIERLAARYAGTCAGCGRAIAVGAQIEYHRAERAAYHVACTGKAQEPAPITTSFTARHRDELPAAGHTFRTRQGKLLIIVRATASRVSQDEVDDQDDFRHGGDAFWELVAHCREATEAEAAPVLAREAADAAAKAAAVAAADAERKTNADAEAEFARLTADLTCSGDGHALPAGLSDGVSVATWADRSVKRSLARHTTPDGTTVYILHTSMYDDYRSAVYAPRPMVEAIWRAWAERHNVTPATAAEWLARYRGCSGEEGYEFIAQT